MDDGSAGQQHACLAGAYRIEYYIAITNEAKELMHEDEHSAFTFFIFSRVFFFSFTPCSSRFAIPEKKCAEESASGISKKPFPYFSFLLFYIIHFILLFYTIPTYEFYIQFSSNEIYRLYRKNIKKLTFHSFSPSRLLPKITLFPLDNVEFYW